MTNESANTDAKGTNAGESSTARDELEFLEVSPDDKAPRVRCVCGQAGYMQYMAFYQCSKCKSIYRLKMERVDSPAEYQGKLPETTRLTREDDPE